MQLVIRHVRVTRCSVIISRLLSLRGRLQTIPRLWNFTPIFVKNISKKAAIELLEARLMMWKTTKQKHVRTSTKDVKKVEVKQLKIVRLY